MFIGFPEFFYEPEYIVRRTDFGVSKLGLRDKTQHVQVVRIGTLHDYCQPGYSRSCTCPLVDASS
jgi:hypothetical protein